MDGTVKTAKVVDWRQHQTAISAFANEEACRGQSVSQSGGVPVSQSCGRVTISPGVIQPELQPEASVRHRVDIIEKALSSQVMNSGNSTRKSVNVSACGQHGGARPRPAISACVQPREGRSDAYGQHGAARPSPATSACMQPGEGRTPAQLPADVPGASHQCMGKLAYPDQAVNGSAIQSMGQSVDQ